jgi:glycine oxidase
MKIVVIGAGAAGLGIGWKLARAGARVTVLERAQVGAGATSASAGMIAAAAEMGHGEAPEAAFARRANALWPDFAKELEAQSGVNIGYRRNGSLMVALKNEVRRHSHGAESPGAANPHAGGGVEMLDAAAARAREPMLTADVAGAMWAPDESVVDSQALCRALAVAFVRAGGEVLSNEAVVRIETDGGKAAGVVTPFRTHRADAYVLAAGAWSSRIEGLPPEAVPPVFPVKGEILVLAQPAGARLPEHTVWGNEIYVTPRGKRLLVGATVERAGYDTSLSQDALEWLRKQSAGLMPSLEEWEIAEHWAGLRPATPDGMPVLGETAVKGLYVAGGQYRNGILFAPALAEVLSRLVLERTAEPSAFDPRRFAGTKHDTAASVIETPHKGGEWRTGF